MSGATDAARDLAAGIRGDVLERGSAGVAEVVAGFNPLARVDAEIVVVPRDEDDVVAAVRAAAAYGLRVRVQSTGHGAYHPVDGGILVLTRDLDEVTVDRERGVVRVGAGVRWRDVLPRLRGTGTTLLTGSSPSVGVAGIVLGGGIGPLSRTFGAVADHVESIRVVTGDGELRDVDSARDPELFWALRGGKVGLGVVTAVTLRTIDLPSIRAGGLFWDAAEASRVYPIWLAQTRLATDAVNSSMNLVRFPDLPELPESLRGRHVLHLRFAYADPSASPEQAATLADAWLAPLRSAAPVLNDTVGDISPSDVGTIHGDPDGPMPIWDRGVFLDGLDAATAARVLETTGRDDRLVVVEVRHLGGALRRGDGAVGGRQAEYGLFVIAAPVPELFAGMPEVWSATHAIVADHVHPVTNYHWIGTASADEYALAWDAETTTRLADVRRAFDPAGVFAAEDRR